MSSAVQDQPSSAGLASRPSFFGGFVSTRKASALPTWQPAKPSESLAQSRSGQADKLKGRPSTQVKSAPAPPPDPVVLRKQQLKANRNFDSDSDTEPEKLKPRAYNQHLAQLEQKLSAAEKAAAAKRPAPKPQHVKQQLQQQQQQQQSAYKSPYNQALPKGSAQMRTIAPKGKAGAASRSMALAPQAISLSRKQMADRGMRKAVEAVRGQGTTPLPQHPASHAQSSSSNSRLGSSANRGPSSMPSTSGRPLHASGPPTGRPMHPSGGPPGRMAASHHPHRPTTLARPTASDASRHLESAWGLDILPR